MNRALLAFAAALLASAASANTLIDNINGIQVDANGQIERFSAIVIGDDGKVKRVWSHGPKPTNATRVVDGGGRTLLPGLIDGASLRFPKARPM